MALSLTVETAAILSWACNNSPRHSGRFMTFDQKTLDNKESFDMLNRVAAKCGKELRAAEDIPLTQACAVVEWVLRETDGSCFKKADIKKALAELLAL